VLSRENIETNGKDSSVITDKFDAWAAGATVAKVGGAVGGGVGDSGDG